MGIWSISGPVQHSNVSLSHEILNDLTLMTSDPIVHENVALTNRHPQLQLNL